MRNMTRMSLLALSVAAAMAIPTAAQAGLYGTVHVAADNLAVDAPRNSTDKDFDELSLSSKASTIGYNLAHQINADTVLYFQYELEANFTTSRTSASSGFETRNSFFLLDTKNGSVKAGRFDNPYARAGGLADLFKNEVGDMRNITQVGDGAREDRYQNTIQFTSKAHNGVTGAVAYSENRNQWEDSGDSKSVSAALHFDRGGAFRATAAYEITDETRGMGNRDAISLAAAYDVTDSLTAVGYFQTVDQHGKDLAFSDKWSSDTYGLGATYGFTDKTTAKAMYLTRKADASDSDMSMWVVGVDHKLSEPMTVYANYAVSDSDNNSRSTPWANGRSDVHAGFDGQAAKAVSVGVKYNF